MQDYYPGLKDVGEAAVMASPRKAYRWVREMEEVGGTFEGEGGWGEVRDGEGEGKGKGKEKGGVWKGVGGVFEVVRELDTDDKRGEGNGEGVEGLARGVGRVLERRRERRGSI